MARKRRYKTNVGESVTFEEEKKPEPVVEDKPTTQKYKVDSVGGLRLRKYPSLDDEIVTILNHCSVIEIDNVKESGEWGHAIIEDGRQGWVMMKYLKKM